VLSLGCIYAATTGFPFLISVIARPIFWPGRYDSIAVPFFALFAASLLLCLPRKPQILFQFFLAGLCGAYFVQAVRASETTNWLLMLDPVPLGDRDAGRAICMQSAPGDFVIYTGLSRAAISYYLQRFNCGDKLKQISYPAELDQHLGWQDERRDYSQEPAARREAESVVDSAYTSRSRIFLLFDPHPRLSAGIVASIERHFRMASSERFISCGTCFSEVRVYVRNPAPLQGQANFYHSPVGQPLVSRPLKTGALRQQLSGPQVARVETAGTNGGTSLPVLHSTPASAPATRDALRALSTPFAAINLRHVQGKTAASTSFVQNPTPTLAFQVCLE
jgi:hypothetical protein